MEIAIAILGITIFVSALLKKPKKKGSIDTIKNVRWWR
jgi:hypothetical protein